MPDAPKNVPAKPTAWDRPAAEIQAIADRAQKGDATALPDVRALLAKPGTADILGGNLAKEAVRTLVTAYAGNNLLVRESVTRKLDEMRAELSGPTPTALEALLVERVVATWLHLHHLETVYAGKKEMSLALGTYYQKSLNAAQKPWGVTNCTFTSRRILRSVNVHRSGGQEVPFDPAVAEG